MTKPIHVLSIESSADETGAAIIRNGKVMISMLASQAKTHSQFGGMVPEVAAREHVPVIIPLVSQALKLTKLKPANLSAIAVTKGPGLMTSLLVGTDTAQSLAWAWDKMLISVNHLEGHIYANFHQPEKIKPSETFPAVILLVSGGHTMLIHMKRHGQLKIIGETVDDAAGEAYDKTAKLLGLPYPGGPMLSKLAVNGNSEKFHFPRPMINSDDFNFSFSGLKTAVLYETYKHPTLNHTLKSDMAASVQTAINEVLISKLVKAVVRYKPRSIMLAGGVAANQDLRQRFLQLQKTYKLKALIPPFEYCTDNAAMIGLAAYWRLKTKTLGHHKPVADPNFTLT